MERWSGRPPAIDRGLNIQTKQFVAYDIPHWVEHKDNPGGYGIDVAGDGGFGFAEREANKIGRLDPATGKIVEYPTPGKDIPRRMGADWEGTSGSASISRKLVKIDHKTGKMTFYTPPTENNGAYHVVADPKNKVIWVTLQTPTRSPASIPRRKPGRSSRCRSWSRMQDGSTSIHPTRTASGGRATPRAIWATSRCWINRMLDAQWRTAGSR
jgi:streptogramin lyase